MIEDDYPTMTLDEFMKELRASVEAFKLEWLRHHNNPSAEGEGPEVWPLEMHSGDWWEAFITFDPQGG